MLVTVSSLERRVDFPNLTDCTIKRKEVFVVFFGVWSREIFIVGQCKEMGAQLCLTLSPQGLWPARLLCP